MNAKWRVGLRGLAAMILAGGLLVGLAGCDGGGPGEYEVREGDILFQPLPHAPLVDAIEEVTRSTYSHCGIVARQGEGWVVIEAIGPVKETPLGEWIRRGRGRVFDAYRLNDELADDVPAILTAARKYLGAPYDIHYRFDEERIYCSELIFKAVRAATGRELGRIEKLGTLNWRPREAFIRSIEGHVPRDREMITPRALSEAPELRRLFSTGHRQ